MIDIIALAVLLLVLVGIVYAITFGRRRYEAYTVKRDQAMWSKIEANAAVMRENERQRQQAENRAKPLGLDLPSSNWTNTARSKKTATSNTASQPATDWSTDLLTTAVVADVITTALSAFANHNNDSNSDSSPSYSDSSSSSDSGPSYD